MTTQGRGLRVAHFDTGRTWRGGQAQVWLLMQGLTRRGVTSLLYAPQGPLLKRARHEGYATMDWNPRGDVDPWAFARAVAALRKARPHLVHAHTARAHAIAVPAARLAGVGGVLVSRRVAVPPGRDLWSALKYRLPVDRYLCVSRSVQGALLDAGLPAGRLAVVPSGVPADREAPGTDLRALLGIPRHAQTVVTVAALTPEKRHEDLLAAAAQVVVSAPDAHFVWIGEGPLRERLEKDRNARGLAGRVHLLGFREDARPLLAQATLAVLASDLEGIATTLIDAQALGIPVVATAVGGIPEVVRHPGSGILVPPRRPDALAEAILRLLLDDDRRMRCATVALEVGREFHIDRTVGRTIEEYVAVLGARGITA